MLAHDLRAQILSFEGGSATSRQAGSDKMFKKMKFSPKINSTDLPSTL